MRYREEAALRPECGSPAEVSGIWSKWSVGSSMAARIRGAFGLWRGAVPQPMTGFHYVTVDLMVRSIVVFAGIAFFAYAFPKSIPFIGLLSLLVAVVTIIGLLTRKFKERASSLAMGASILFMICVALSSPEDVKQPVVSIELAAPSGAQGVLGASVQKRIRCEKGDLAACRELCDEGLNGNRSGYSCP